jgi:hypothetical protein
MSAQATWTMPAKKLLTAGVPVPGYTATWQIERDGSVWTATEHPGPAALHVLVAHDLNALEPRIIEAELAS